MLSVELASTKCGAVQKPHVLNSTAHSVAILIFHIDMFIQKIHLRLYLLFLLMATATVLSPAPGVVMTLTNSLRYEMQGTFSGILGISFGAMIVTGVSATSVGFLLAASAPAFTILKLVGAAYLIYLGIRLWHAPLFNFT